MQILHKICFFFWKIYLKNFPHYFTNSSFFMFFNHRIKFQLKAKKIPTSCSNVLLVPIHKFDKQKRCAKGMSRTHKKKQKIVSREKKKLFVSIKVLTMLIKVFIPIWFPWKVINLIFACNISHFSPTSSFFNVDVFIKCFAVG